MPGSEICKRAMIVCLSLTTHDKLVFFLKWRERKNIMCAFHYIRQTGSLFEREREIGRGVCVSRLIKWCVLPN